MPLTGSFAMDAGQMRVILDQWKSALRDPHSAVHKPLLYRNPLPQRPPISPAPTANAPPTPKPVTPPIAPTLTQPTMPSTVVPPKPTPPAARLPFAQTPATSSSPAGPSARELLAANAAASGSRSDNNPKKHAKALWRSWKTSVGFHDNEPISQVLYSPQFNNVSPDDGQGFLVSSSRSLLNLWRCYPCGEELQLVHQTSLDLPTQPSIDFLDAQLLVSANAGPERCQLNLFSLDGNNFFERVGKSLAFSVPPRQPNAPLLTPQVVSLNSLGATVQSYVAVNVGSCIHFCDLRAPLLMAQVTVPNGEVTVLRPCRFKVRSLLTGLSTGMVQIYDLNRKPDVPVLSILAHQSAVTFVTSVDDNTVITAGGETVNHIDLRRASAPVRTWVPDGKPVIKACYSMSSGQIAAFTHKGGVFTMFYSGAMVDNVVNVLEDVVTAVTWNEQMRSLYSANSVGGIDVLRAA